MTLSTMMVARVSKLPYIGKPEDQPVKSHEVFTTIVSKDVDSKPDVVPLWVVVLSAVAGTLILLLLIYLLYVVSFSIFVSLKLRLKRKRLDFKRKR